MVAAKEYPDSPDLYHAQDGAFEPPRTFRLRVLAAFAALAAPFTDMDERALYKKRKHVAVRNNSKGNMFTPRAAAPIQVPVRRFQRSDD
jgi:hypothetical protein